MKTNSESHGHEVNAAKSKAAPPDEHLSQELRPQLDAIIGLAERLRMKSESDENVQQILTTARGLLDVINRESTDAPDRGRATGQGPNEQCDVLYIEDDSKIFASVKLLLGSKRSLKVLQAINGETGIAFAQTHDPKLILLDLDL